MFDACPPGFISQIGWFRIAPESYTLNQQKSEKSKRIDMFIRLITIGLLCSVIVIVPAFLLLSDPVTLPESNLLGMLGVITFLVSLLSAWLGSRLGMSQNQTNVSSIDENRELGTVKWFNASKGFGFITRDSGEDVFVHFRSIRGKGHRVLKDGQRVDFLISESTKGLQAEDVAVAR
ncbi:MAG: cold-shock protein [Gammaproteobacteria bacterium]